MGVEAAHQIGLVQGYAQQRPLNPAHQGDDAAVLGDVVVAPDYPAPDTDARQHHQQHHCEHDNHPRSRPTRSTDRLDLRWNTFGGFFTGVDSRGPARGGVGQRGQLVVFTGYRAGENRLSLAVVVVDDVGDHDRHVVGTAAAERQFDEAVGAFGHIGDLQGLVDGFVADRVGQPVRAEQVTVPGAGFSHGQEGLDLVTGQCPHDQRALGVAVRLLRGDPAFVDQGLDKGVVFGYLGQFAVPQHVTA